MYKSVGILNKIMRDSIHMLNINEENYVYQNCSSNITSNTNLPKDSCIEFFDEIADKWFIYHEKYLLGPNGRIYRYNIFVDISEQKNNHSKIIESHIKLLMDTKHLENINRNLQTRVKEQLSKFKKKNELLFVHQKQASLDNIMSIIAHQWKQPLHELSINNIFLNKKNKNSKLNKIYDENAKIIQFLSSTINTFKNFYQSSNQNKFCIKIAIKDTILIFKSIFCQYNVKVILNFDDELLEIVGQKNLFSQVVLSILENAISIFIERNISSPTISINLDISKNDKIILTIQDNAGGIDEKNLAHIFKNNKSFRKKPSTGLGLYVSKLIIVEKFNGTIIAMNIDEGARFIITLLK